MPFSSHQARAATRWLVVLAVTATGCGKERLDYRGTALEQAATWSRAGMTASVFVPVGQSLPSADLQVGVLHSTDHATGEALLGWITSEFERVPMVKPSSQTSGDEACKAALSNGTDIRPFMTLQICRTGVGAAACAEADQRLTDSETGCLAMTPGCFERLCNGRWIETRQVLEPIVARALEEHRR